MGATGGATVLLPDWKGFPVGWLEWVVDDAPSTFYLSATILLLVLLPLVLP